MSLISEPNTLPGLCRNTWAKELERESMEYISMDFDHRLVVLYYKYSPRPSLMLIDLAGEFSILRIATSSKVIGEYTLVRSSPSIGDVGALFKSDDDAACTTSVPDLDDLRSTSDAMSTDLGSDGVPDLAIVRFAGSLVR